MDLRIPTPAQLQTIYAADLVPSFPPAELKPLRAIQELWAQDGYRPWCLFDGDAIVGEAFLWLGAPGWSLLDYLCVSARNRSAGIGASLLEQLRAAEAGSVILAESEAPEHAPDPAMARRRLGFYARCGLRTAGYDTEIFGVHYKTLYLSDGPVADEILMNRHREIYENRFSPEKFARYVRIPRNPALSPAPQVPWDE